MEYYTQAIVLSRSDLREYDRLFCLYTRNLGKAVAVAKGIRRLRSKMAGQLEPFGLLAIKIVRGRGLDTISNVETVRRYQQIAKDFDLLALARYCLRLVDELVKEGSCDLGILELLSQVLAVIDEPSQTLAEKKFLTAVFSLKLLTHLGYRPELHDCLVCHKKIIADNMVLNARRGGLVCGSCEQGLVVSEDDVKLLRLILANDFNFFVDNAVSEPLRLSTSPLIAQFVRVIREV